MMDDIERLLRQLEPIMPRQVRRWREARHSGGAELRGLIDRQIRAAARRVLGNDEDRMLLSLPPEKIIDGPLHIGTVLYEADKWPFGLRHDELLQGLSIFGRAGSGKTNLCFGLLRQLQQQDVAWIFLDWKRTGRHALSLFPKPVKVFTPGRNLAPLRFNPFVAPPGMEPHLYRGQVIDVIAQAYSLGDGSRSILQRALTPLDAEGTMAPTVQQVLDQVEQAADNVRSRSWKASTIRALEGLLFADLVGDSNITQEEQVRVLTEGWSIIEFNGLASNAKQFLVPVLTLWLYHVMLRSPVREQLRLVLLLDEAHHLLYRSPGRSAEPLIESLLRQFRELGVGVIVCDQHVHLTAAAATGNTYASIFLNQKDPPDIHAAASICNLDPADRWHLSTLPVGHCIARLQGRWTRPFVARVPLLPIDKGLVTDAVLREYLARPALPELPGLPGVPGAGSTLTPPHAANNGGFRQIPGVDEPLNGDAIAFLEDVLDYPNDGVKARYRRLRWGGSKGDRTKQWLVRRGWLETQVVPIGQSRALLLRLTPRAVASLGLDQHRTRRESLAHAYWKSHYARWFEKEGYHVTVEAPRFGGTVDVLAEKDGKRIGVEIETGKSDVAQNVRNGLRSGFEQIIVVAVSSAAYRKITADLARNQLLIPRRVVVTHQNSYSIDKG